MPKNIDRNFAVAPSVEKLAEMCEHGSDCTIAMISVPSQTQSATAACFKSEFTDSGCR